MGLARTAPQEYLFVHLVVHQRPHLLRQAPAGNHVAGNVGRPLDVIGRTGGHAILAECHFFGDAATKQAADLADDKAPAVAVAILHRQEHRHTQGATAGDNAHLVHGVVLGQQATDDGVPRLVVGGVALLVLGHHHGFALGAHHDLVLGHLELGHTNGAHIGARRKQGRLVHQVGEVRAREPRGAAGDLAGFHVLRQRHLAHMHLENLLAAADIRQANHHLPIEAPRAQQGGVEHVGPVGGGDNNHAVVDFKTVHLDQQLVEGLLPLVVPTAESGAAMAADRVDLVDKNNTGGLFLGLVEHIAHPGGAHADKHFHEIGSGDGEERHLGLAGDGLGQQGFTGARLPDHQDAPWNTTTEFLEAAGITQEIHQFLDVLLGLVHARHVGERRGDLVLAQQPRLALAKAHGATASTRSALHLAHKEHEYGDNDQDGEAGHQQLAPDTLLLGLAAFHDHLVFQQVVDQLGILHHRANGLKTGAIDTLAGDSQAVDHHPFHLVALDLLDKLRITHLLGLALHVEIVEYREQDRGNDQPKQQVFNHIVQNCFLTWDAGAISRSSRPIHQFTILGAISPRFKDDREKPRTAAQLPRKSLATR